MNKETINNILSLSKATNWEIRDSGDSIYSQLFILGLSDEEIITVQSIMDSIVSPCYRINVTKGEFLPAPKIPGNELTFLLNGEPCAYSMEYSVSTDQTIRLKVPAEGVTGDCSVKTSDVVDAMKYIMRPGPDAIKPANERTDYPFYTTHGAWYNESEKPTKKEITSLSEWYEATKQQRDELCGSPINIETATGEDLDKLAQQGCAPSEVRFKKEELGSWGAAINDGCTPWIKTVIYDRETQTMKEVCESASTWSFKAWSMSLKSTRIENEESSEPVVKYTPEEFAEKCKDPVFKLASDMERDMYDGEKIVWAGEFKAEPIQFQQMETGTGIYTLGKLDKIEVSSDGTNWTTLKNKFDHKSRHYISFSGHEEFDYCEKCQEKL